MFPQWWKQSLAAVASRLFHWLVVNWVWKVLRIVILLPNKTDILSEKYVCYKIKVVELGKYLN